MPHILIIDDDHLVRAATKAILNAKGYNVDVAENGVKVYLANKHYEVAPVLSMT